MRGKPKATYKSLGVRLYLIGPYLEAFNIEAFNMEAFGLKTFNIAFIVRN